MVLEFPKLSRYGRYLLANKNRNAGPPSLEDRRPVGRCEYIYMYVLFNVLFRLTRDPYIARFDQDTK